METYRAIPQGYMTVGTLAKKMNTTVRTLQYYDKEGVLSPSAASEGGRRLYTDRDVILLHQIQSMKYLGFSLDDIKNRLVSLDTPEQVADALARQAEITRDKLSALAESLRAIEALREEVVQMKSVDWGKYSAIIVNLQMKNDMYSVIKHMDDELIEYAGRRFDMESAKSIMERMSQTIDKALRYQNKGISPDSEQGLALAKDFWDTVIEYLGGDMSLFPKMTQLYGNLVEAGDDWGLKHEKANVFLEPALGAYFEKMGINPFEEGNQ